ncbi:MAG: hypothetical protein ACTTH8_02970 [Treponema sp.]
MEKTKQEINDEKALYYQEEINQILEQEKTIASMIVKDPDGSMYKKIMLADEMIYLVTLYLAKYQLAASFSAGKAEGLLNDARKALYKVIICLEEIVTNLIDAPFSEYEDKVEKIKHVPQKHRYYLVRKLGLALDLVMRAYGTNSKWKWSFVELQGRFAVVSKNILDLKDTASSGLDPRSPDYETTMFHVRLVKRLLMQAADKYREKYEMATSSLDDFRLAIQYLSALYRIHIILNERNAAEEVKKKIDIWSDKMEKDTQRKKGR